ncbi:MAG: hypothetical protein J6N49_04430 [Alphaproteobacteria bacterium]|nr:hypothetical protein [Alphaproteobacteria bacterium]
MKKILFILAVCLVSLLSFSSCGAALEISEPYPYPATVVVSTPGYYYTPVYPRYYYGRPYYRRPLPPPPPRHHGPSHRHYRR